MSTPGIVLTIGGLLLVALGIFALTRRERPLRRWRPGDRISLIELGISKIDPNFRPAGEQPWERKFDRLLIWTCLFGGVVLAGVGLTSD